MMRTTAALLAAALLATACATTRNAPAQAFRPKGTDQAVTITGRLEVTDPVFTTGHTLTVSINGQDAITAPLGDGNADITGTWQGKPVLSLCSRARNIWTGTYTITCRVVIDGEFAGTLTL